MKFKGSFFSSRPFIVSFIGVLSLVILVVIGGTVLLVRNAWLNMRISSICPDYFSYEYAWVVDENGKGIDSVAVTMRDNSNVNLIYRVFTDSTGRFVLFHDFGSFALHDIPFSYFLYVSADGWSDTIRYMFERYRGCHFRKTDGPDTIVRERSLRDQPVVQLEQVRPVMIDSGFGFVPWNEMALSLRLPGGVRVKLPSAKVLYTSLTIAGSPIPFAVMPDGEGPATRGWENSQTEGVRYLFDRDGDGDLTNEKPVLFTSEGSRADGTPIDCTVRTCCALDSVLRGHHRYYFNLQLRGMRQRGGPVLRVRRADAVTGTLVLTSDLWQPPPPRVVNTGELFDAFEPSQSVDTLRYRLLLWDRGLRGYADPLATIMGIDRDHNGVFDRREGSAELCEHIAGRIVFDRFSFVVDTISTDGRRLYYRDLRSHSGKPAGATVGTWTDNFTAAATSPLSLYQECAANRYVLLYFFEGAAEHLMTAPEVSLLVALMREQLGAIRLIGISRRSAGAASITQTVINENRGWDGPLVRQFHNHRNRELICLDAQGTIVFRGVPDTKAIAGIWKHAGVDDVVARAVYEQRLAGRVVDRAAE